MLVQSSSSISLSSAHSRRCNQALAQIASSFMYGLRQSSDRIIAAYGASSSSSSSSEPQWFDNLRQDRIKGPEGSENLFPPREDELGYAKSILGTQGFRDLESASRDERQRVWDAMRASAWGRYQKGELPDWFNPSWLMQSEAPINRMLRLQGHELYKVDNTWSPGGGGKGGGKGQGKKSTGGSDDEPSDEEDPYWILRDHGDHPMRWWTLGFGALLLIGGIVSYSLQQVQGLTPSSESLWIGGIAGAALSTCSAAMSDWGEWGHAGLAVKAAWLICALIASKEVFLGWTHRPVPIPELDSVQWGGGKGGGQRIVETRGTRSKWGATSSACLLMCMFYMWTGMSDLHEISLPTTPGAVFKINDVTVKNRVYQSWGYTSNVPMQ